ncbi:alpha/beta fold hydrolase [Streptomyces sp. NPDC059071]|uniref:alpha/beta fold hydrolase n=1 Tax=unclassified Streptomyces TaxID=2593676 RepID=UPI0036546DDE
MTLAHDVAGDGPSTVLLLHSGVCDRRMWDGQFHALAEAGHRVVRCDLRGFGDSPIDRPHVHADDIRELLDHLGVERAALVGSSFGGEVALEFTVRHPGRTTALALLCAAAPGHEAGPELREFFTRERALLVDGDIAAAADLNVDFWLGPDADADARELVRRMQTRAFELQLPAPDEFAPGDVEVTDADLAAIGVPVLVATGAHDVPDFRAIGDRLARLFPDVRRIELDRAGHLPAVEHPEETAKLLLDFLGSRDLLGTPAA